jgi:ribonucleotide reductase beta subunit family protein with ferritin-like domain
VNPVQFKVSSVEDVKTKVKGMTVFNTEQKDRGDYQTLRPEQKHIYTSNLKYQIMLDSIQGRGPGMAFIPYCSLPELEACMEVWGFMEMIHSRSYTYIIKNVYSDPSEVFDKIVTDDRILERASSVTQGYDDFIQSAHQYDGSTMWELATEGHTAGQYDRREVKRKLYRAVANVNILEGIRFYVSFACSFAFGELKLMDDKLLQQYVEWIANRRLKAIGLKPQYDIAASNNPLPWTQHWISSKGLQVAPQETEVESYVVGGIKQDVKKDTFSGFKL